MSQSTAEFNTQLEPWRVSSVADSESFPANIA